MNAKTIVRILAKSEIFDDDGLISDSLSLCKRIFNGDVSYIVIHNGTRAEFECLMHAIKKFNELNYSLI